MVCVHRVVLLFVLVDIAAAAIFNSSFLDASESNGEGVDNNLREHQMRISKKTKKFRSTSSSSEEGKLQSAKSSDRKESLEISELSTSDSSKKKKTPKKSGGPKSSKERKGWKKWHRKCTPCPEDMRLKWRDHRIKWICGSYQRARRSFKSLCMMHYRNCQDGTMFTKMSDHRCSNTSDILSQGQHFFYDYQVQLSDETSKSKSSKSDSDETSSSQKQSSSESWDSDKFGPRDADSRQFKNRMNMAHN